MSHTLHRYGTKEENKIDFTFISLPAIGFNNTPDCVEKLQRTMKIFLRHNPVNAGLGQGGNLYTATPDQLVEDAMQGGVMAVYDNRKDVKDVLQELSENKFSISVVVQGLTEEIFSICEEIGLKVHSMDQSLGIWGDKKRLADDGILKILTMCGHGMISANLVKNTINKLSKKQINLDEAIERLAKPCRCGVFNPSKAKLIIEQFLSSGKD